MLTLVTGSALRSPEAVLAAIRAYAAAGVDELVLDPTLPDRDQVSQLAEMALR